MIYKDIELFNVDEIRETSQGLKLYRFPREIIENLSVKSSALLTTGIEIRFIGEAVISLGAIDEDGIVEIFRGDIFHSVQYLKKGKNTTFTLSYNCNRDVYLNDNKEWRIVFAHDFRGMICDIEPLGKISPPNNEKKRIVAYGSSITHGACSLVYSNSNIFNLAKLLNADIENKGIGGGCLCESVIGGYLAGKAYDLLLLELGVNMMGQIDADEFYQRVELLLKKINLDIPTVIVTPYLHFRDISNNPDERKISKSFYEALVQIHKENKKIHFINGHEILDNTNMLTCDLVHPSVYGHKLMSTRLFEKIKNII